MKITEKHKAYTKQYREDHYEQISLNLPKGERDIINAAAKERGMSTNKFIVNLIERELGIPITDFDKG